MHNFSPADLNSSGELELTPNWCVEFLRNIHREAGDEGLARSGPGISLLPPTGSPQFPAAIDSQDRYKNKSLE